MIKYRRVPITKGIASSHALVMRVPAVNYCSTDRLVEPWVLLWDSYTPLTLPYVKNCLVEILQIISRRILICETFSITIYN